MKVPCCSVCQTRYNEEERAPLLLHCGHGFCKECLSRMFSSSLDNSLSCPRCRHVTLVGNSVTALRKNFALLSLAGGSNSSDDDVSDGDNAGDDEYEEFEDRRRSSNASISGGGCGVGGAIELHVCTFHGVMRMDNSLCLFMDRCYGSVQSEMQRNEGRLTLEQILSGKTLKDFLEPLPREWISDGGTYEKWCSIVSYNI